MKIFCWLISATIVLSLLSAPSMADGHPKTTLRSPGEIAAQAPADHWRQVGPDNLLLIELDWGTVAVELAPDFAPNHVKQMQVLTHNKFYDGLSFYRVIEQEQGAFSLALAAS